MLCFSDGPAKSFAFRRLRYLDSSWQMYILLNEFQEMADSKVTQPIPLTTVHALTVPFCR
jgi:AMP deaminase